MQEKYVTCYMVVHIYVVHFVSACLVKLKTNEVFLAVTIPGIDHKALSWVKTHAHYQLMISIIDHICDPA